MNPYKYIDWDSIPVFMTIDEAAALLRVDNYTLRKYLRTGVLSGVKLGEKWLVSKEYLRQALTPQK